MKTLYKMIVWLLMSTTLMQAQKGVPIPAVNFGMHVNNTTADYPLVIFGSYRFWDTNSSGGVTARWQTTNPSLGNFNFVTVDAWMNKLGANNVFDATYSLGITPQWASSVPGDTNCNYSGTGENGGCDPPLLLNSDGTGSNQHWRNWIKAIAQHTKASTSGVHISAWEIWNEFTRQSGQTGVTPSWNGTNAQMIRMAQDVRCIIAGRGSITATGETCAQVWATVGITAAIDPTALILSPSSAASDRWNTLFEAYLTAGGSTPAEALAFHPYPGDGNPKVAENSQSEVTTMKALLSPTDAAKQFWCTEGGWGNNANNPDADLQAGYVARYYLLLWAGGCARNYWYAYNNTTFSTLWLSGTGLTKAGKVYPVVYNWMVGSSMNQLCTGPTYPATGVWICYLVQSDGTQTQAVWDSSQSCSGGTCTTSSYTYDPKYVSYQDTTGAVITLPATHVNISAKPIMLFNVPGTVVLQGKWGLH